MSMIAEVVAATGASREDVVRVATHGGVGDADRVIAEAIEAAGGRRAADMMVAPWQAEHERLQRALWHETKDEDKAFLAEHAAAAGVCDITPLFPAVIEDQPAPAPMTNPRAVHNPEVTIYPEHTSPEESREIIAYHPHDIEDAAEDEDQDDELVAAEHLAATVHADLAEALDDPVAATRLTAAWSSPEEGRALLAEVLSLHAAPALRARVLDRQNAALAA